MSMWKKIIVSGSQAELTAVTASSGILVGTSQQIGTSQANTILSGSFTGSFVGDGSALSGLVTNLFISASDDGNITTGSVSILNQSLILSASEGLNITVTDQTVTIAGEDASTTNKGVASFSDSYFVVNTGVVSISSSAITATQLNTSVAGTGLTGGGGSALTVVYGSGSGTAVQGNTTITLNGTANEIEITGTAAQALGLGPTYTIGLPDNVTVASTLTASTGSILGNLTVGGNLIINGDTTVVNTTNLLVEDRFILLNSGSVPGGDVQGGLIVDAGSSSGSAVFYSAAGAVNRWGFAENITSTATTATQTAYLAAVSNMQVAEHASAIATYQKVGNIKIDNGEIYIWA